ncbi:MAG: hypothetical protein ACLFUS_17600 [Candidatus Sumerlaeia bacterium]
MWNKSGNEKETRVPPDPEQIKPSVASRLNLLILLIIGLLFFLYFCMVMAGTFIGFYREFGWRSEVYDFSLPHLLFYTGVAFGFNALFGAFFGIHIGRLSAQREMRNRGLMAPSQKAPWYARYGYFFLLLLWWFIFNIPLFFFGEKRPRSILVRSFPPDTFYPPMAFKLIHFMTQGNYGLFGGFILGVVIGNMREFRQKRR